MAWLWGPEGPFLTPWLSLSLVMFPIPCLSVSFCKSGSRWSGHGLSALWVKQVPVPACREPTVMGGALGSRDGALEPGPLVGGTSGSRMAPQILARDSGGAQQGGCEGQVRRCQPRCGGLSTAFVPWCPDVAASQRPPLLPALLQLVPPR